MNKTTIGIIIALLFCLTMILLLGGSSGITGLAVTDRITSFFVRQSISSTGPITILSIIFAAGVLGLYEVKKK